MNYDNEVYQRFYDLIKGHHYFVEHKFDPKLIEFNHDFRMYIPIMKYSKYAEIYELEFEVTSSRKYIYADGDFNIKIILSKLSAYQGVCEYPRITIDGNSWFHPSVYKIGSYIDIGEFYVGDEDLIRFFTSDIKEFCDDVVKTYINSIRNAITEINPFY